MKLPRPKSLYTTIAMIVTTVSVAGLSACYNVGDAVNDAVRDIKQPTVMSASKAEEITVIATLASISEYDWKLVEASVQDASLKHYESAIASNKSRLNFDVSDNDAQSGSVNFNLGCNTNFGKIQLVDGVVSLAGDIVSTMMGCGELTDIDAKFIKELDGSTLTINKDTVNHKATLVQTNGSHTMVWQGNLKPEVRFGEPVRLFWEIAPEQVACIDESGKDQLCLRVRNINYDDRGIRTGAGAWRTFYGNIDGYTHNPELRQIVRLNAYNNPNGEPNPYYVYDMSVMTEIAK